MQINWTIIVDVQHIFHFDLDLIADPGQGRKHTYFYAWLLYDGWCFVCSIQPKPLHIFTSYLVPINCKVIVHVQHSLNFDLDLFAGQGHKACHNDACLLYDRFTQGQCNIPCSNRKLHEPMLMYGL